ncbi:MAG: acetyl-CoA C-acetyltransferase [Bdellovibrionales bacterium]|nr:acetyl-CoA C-acetyltransferase [Bdellovibrionales bacterium]
MAESLVFLSGKRTPFGANGGSLRDVTPTELGVTAAKAALEQSGVPAADIDHVIVGNVLHSAADSIYTPRHVGLKVGVPLERPALGINRLCGSGFQVVVEAYQQFCAGDSRVALVGGVENMSMSPYLARGARWGTKMGSIQMTDSMMESLHDSYPNAPMAITAENLAVKYGISRAESDAFSLQSQQRAAAAAQAGNFKNELAVHVISTGKGDPVRVEKDEHPRPQTTPEGLAKLKPLFKKDGVVTAGNASGIVDGAAFLVVASESESNRRKLKPLGRLVAYGVCGCEPSIMGIGPAPAARIALKKAGLTLQQMDLVEFNEAFAPQVLSVQKELGIDPALLNVNGGAIAIGHPLAASGARIVQHLLYELRRRGKRYGLGAACIGGGQGIALILEAFHD